MRNEIFGFFFGAILGLGIIFLVVIPFAMKKAEAQKCPVKWTPPTEGNISIGNN